MDISAEEFNSRYKDPDSFSIIDVREELEFQTYNVGGENLPLGKFLRDIEELDYSKDEEIVLICQRGLRSQTATQALQQNGYKNARNLSGGLLALRRINSNTTH